MKLDFKAVREGKDVVVCLMVRKSCFSWFTKANILEREFVALTADESGVQTS